MCPIIIESQSTSSNFLSDKNCSYLVTSVDFNEKISNVILILEKLITDKMECNNKGEKGRLIIELYYSKEVVVRKYISLVNQLLSE